MGTYRNPRTAAIGSAVFLLLLSAAVIAIINNVEFLVYVQNYKGDPLPDDVRSFQNLMNSTQDVAAWLIAWNIVIIVAVTVSIILAANDIESNIIGIIEICFSTIAILAYIATCIVCAVNAAAWGEPPALCVSQNDFTKDKDVSCDTIYIGVTCVVALQAVFCFTVAGKFGVIIIKVIKNMISRSADEASEPSEETETKNNLTNTYIVGRVIVS